MTEQRFALAVLDTVDHRRLDALSAIGEHAICSHHLPHGRLASAKRVAEAIGHVVVDPEPFGVLPDPVHPDGLGQSNGHGVQRQLQCPANRGWTGKLSRRILWCPRPASGSNLDRTIEYAGLWRISHVQSRRVDDWLEAGPRLTPCLRCTVERALFVTESTLKRQNASGVRIHRHERTLHFRDLAHCPSIVFAFHEDYIPSGPDVARRSRATVSRWRPADPLPFARKRQADLTGGASFGGLRCSLNPN